MPGHSAKPRLKAARWSRGRRRQLTDDPVTAELAHFRRRGTLQGRSTSTTCMKRQRSTVQPLPSRWRICAGRERRSAPFLEQRPGTRRGALAHPDRSLLAPPAIRSNSRRQDPNVPNLRKSIAASFPRSAGIRIFLRRNQRGNPRSLAQIRVAGGRAHLLVFIQRHDLGAEIAAIGAVIFGGNLRQRNRIRSRSS